MSSQMLATSKVFYTKVLATNEVGDVKGVDRSKHMKLKTKKSESQKLANSQK